MFETDQWSQQCHRFPVWKRLVPALYNGDLSRMHPSSCPMCAQTSPARDHKQDKQVQTMDGWWSQCKKNKKHQALYLTSGQMFFYIALFLQQNKTILKIYLLFVTWGYGFAQDGNTMLTDSTKSPLPRGKLVQALVNARQSRTLSDCLIPVL